MYTLHVYYYCMRVLVLTLLADKGQGPGENIHEIGKIVGMGGANKLTDIQKLVIKFQTSPFVFVDLKENNRYISLE